MKECFKCHEVLPLSAFYKHPMMGDGHLGKCRACTRKDVRENREKKVGHYQEYARMRTKRPERQAAIKASAKKYPLHDWARRATNSALAHGLLVRQACEVCGDERSDAHHEDYTKPLEIRWLCRLHHMRLHGERVA